MTYYDLYKTKANWLYVLGLWDTGAILDMNSKTYLGMNSKTFKKYMEISEHCNMDGGIR